MSIHSLISSNITNIGDLTAILDELGIDWKEKDAFYMKATGRPPAHAIEAIIGNEAVWVFQAEVGEGFVFQSQGWRFRNKGNITALASVQSVEGLQAQNRLNEQQRVEEERQARLNEQQQLEDRKRRQREEAEQNRVAEEHRKVEEERQRIEEQQRQSQLADQAKNLLGQFDAQRSQSVKPDSNKLSAPSAASPAAVEQMDRIIGKLHQADALRKIRERLPELKEKFGATLDREETLDDDTVELRLTM